MAEVESVPPPVKEVKSPMLMKAWLDSPAYKAVVGFLEAASASVRSKSLSDPVERSPVTEGLKSLLVQLRQGLEQFPPQTQPQRFGNKAFRDWHAWMTDKAQGMMEKVLPASQQHYAAHLGAYLSASFGDATRIDFGTGHEVAFLFLLAALGELRLIEEKDLPAVVNVVFVEYVELVYSLVRTYCMEPAGSHGSWSLDDYHFLPFLWGASQMIGHSTLEPQHFPDKAVAEHNAQDWLFMKMPSHGLGEEHLRDLQAIAHIHATKTGPFAEHSAQLWNVSGVAAWPKVNQGLIKMFKAEVLGKFPVAQHFLFGQLLPFKAQ